MRTWVTEIRALDWRTETMKDWEGPRVQGITWQDAQNNADKQYGGYLRVIGELVADIPTKEDGFTPDWDKEIDYQKPNHN